MKTLIKALLFLAALSAPSVALAQFDFPTRSMNNIANGLTVTGGAISLTGNTTSSLTTSSGTLSVSGAGGLNLQGNGINAVIIDSSGNITFGNATTNTIAHTARLTGNLNFLKGANAYVITADTETVLGNAGSSFTYSSGIGAAASGATAGANGGGLTFTASAGGAGTASLAAGQGGALTFNAGNAGAANGGAGAGGNTITFNAGIGTGGGNPGGSVTANGGAGGAADTANNGGQGGTSQLNGGNGGAASATKTAGQGGNAVLNGGNAGSNGAGGGGQYGGDVVIRGGTHSGAGLDGTVYVGDSHTNAVNVGASGIVTTVTGNFAVSKPVNATVGGSLSSSATIAPTAPIHHVTGTTTINNITVPSGMTTGQITLIPDGLWATGVSGNIAIATTAVVSKAVVMTYDSTASKWYPSY